MKWYIHIGPNKTATTTIQNALNHARKKLERNGVVYPRSGLVANAHHVFQYAINIEFTGQAPMAEVFGITNVPTLENLVDEARQEARYSNAENILISSETLWDWGPTKIKRFRDVLGADDAVIVMSMRPHFDRELSMWQEVVKHGFTKSPLEYLSTYSDTAVSSDGKAYYERANRWKKTGFDIMPIPFPSREVEVPVWDYFLDKTLSFKIGSIQVPSVLNDSLDYFSIMMMQYVFDEVIKQGLHDAKLDTRNQRLVPIKVAVQIREKVVSHCEKYPRKRYPAYAGLLLDPDIESVAYDRYGMFLRDISSICGLAGKRLSISKFVDHHKPAQVLVGAKALDDFNEDAVALNTLAKENAAELVEKM